jgi:AcrR family transcriptional regulator
MAKRTGNTVRSTVPEVDETEVASKSALTRARILDAAAQVLSEQGYAGLRLTDVAAVAEIQAPAIYYYYGSRDELIEEVMWAGIADMREHMAGALAELPDGTPPLDRLLLAVETHLRHALEISDYTTASIRNAGQVPLTIRKRQILEEERYGEIWRRLINDLAREGWFTAGTRPLHRPDAGARGVELDGGVVGRAARIRGSGRRQRADDHPSRNLAGGLRRGSPIMGT